MAPEKELMRQTRHIRMNPVSRHTDSIKSHRHSIKPCQMQQHQLCQHGVVQCSTYHLAWSEEAVDAIEDHCHQSALAVLEHAYNPTLGDPLCVWCLCGPTRACNKRDNLHTTR